MNELNNAIDKVKIPTGLKDEIFNNIIEKAENENHSPKVIKHNFAKYIPLVAAVFVFAVIWVFGGDMLNPADNSISPAVRTSDFNETPIGYNTETITFTAYMPSDNGFDSYVIEDCPIDPFTAWIELKSVGFVPEEIQLLQADQTDTDITLSFNSELELYSQQNNEDIFEAIQLSYQTMYPNLEVIVVSSSNE